jgi:hypothetical protein
LGKINRKKEMKYLDCDVDIGECLPQVGLLHGGGDVGEVQRGRGRVDILVVLHIHNNQSIYCIFSLVIQTKK